MRAWLKREMLVAGRHRVLASVILLTPILLMMLLLLAILLATALGFLNTN